MTKFSHRPSRWLVTGASGLLGHHLVKHLNKQGANTVGIINTHTPVETNSVSVQLDLLQPAALSTYLSRERFDVILHGAGLTNVDFCENNEPYARKLHAEVSGALAREARQKNAKFVYISTDHLWDGTRPFIKEGTPPTPLNAYARTKWEGEQQSLSFNPESLIIRTNFFGPGLPWRPSFSDWMINCLTSGEPLNGFVDSFFTPISTDHLCQAITDLIEREAKGVYNVVGSDRVSKYEFASRLADLLEIDKTRLHAALTKDAGLVAPRPRDMSLSSKKVSRFLGREMPSLSISLKTLL
ncbi:SDR family oxidoreductase [Kiloniella laminariae]|uniref:SDR family oxidoreductase n=1 Tax=Kiloniella laminariae TaxID=454162 RepID=UPI00035C152D|nr:SDR family oxidoreductase [Kiloniella laminariae]